MAFGNIFKPLQQLFTGGSKKKPKPSQAASQAQAQAQAQQAQQAAAEAERRAAAARAAAELSARKGRNESEIQKRGSEQMEQASKEATETVVNREEQKEREKMVRTFKSGRKGRASLRINLGSGSGSAYEGSSGISITL